MPMIEMTYPAGALEPDVRDALTDELAGILLGWEGAPDTDFFRANTWVYVNEVDGLAVGGRPGGDPRFRVDVTTPEGAFSDRRREGLVADVNAAVLRAAGLQEEDGFRVWVLLREIAEGGWGAGGGIIRFEQLKAAAKAERESAKAEPVA
jgi:phenylpyruvate tautomerase PptA (4-oxalocrotonate tautomerase family)